MVVYKHSVRILLSTLLVYTFLVATHLGEFWPFSIYPMFSQGGNPWTRALVMDVSAIEDQQKWSPTEIDRAPGDPFALNAHDIDQIDLANYISKTNNWDANRLLGLRNMFGEDLISQKDLMVMKVNGLIHDDNSITIQSIPFVLLTADSTYLNPNLPHHAYFSHK